MSIKNSRNVAQWELCLEDLLDDLTAIQQVVQSLPHAEAHEVPNVEYHTAARLERLHLLVREARVAAGNIRESL